nr:hypothetical protein [Tanacetum cinerariifolium]
MHWFYNMMVWEAMTEVFKQKRNLPTMLLWPSLLQVLLLTMRYHSGDGYHAVPPPYTETFMPPKPDLVFHNAPNDVETVHTAFNVELSHTKPDNDLSHTHRPSAPIIEDWVSNSEDESETKIPQNVPSFVQHTEQVKSPRPSVQHVETSILTAIHKIAIPKPTSNGNRKNRKACFVCQSLDHLIKDCDFYEKAMAQTSVRNHAQKGNNQHYARMPLPNPQRHVVPTAVLTKSKLVPITAARPVTTAVPNTNVTRPRQAKPIVTKPYSPPRRHINRSPSPKASNFPLKVTAVKGNPQHALKDKGVIDSGCSRHMTGNMSYQSDFEELNGRYVAFGGNPKGGKISGKGKIRTGKLDFDDVYFVKELKFNLFSVSQMCDKKNSVLFTDTECFVLSLEFKLPDENQATLDESNLWHRRLGHINFKTINKLVKGNLVRGLPTKVFENDHTCVACKKGKQHRASCKTKLNTDVDATFEVKEPEFEGRKPESEVHVSPSSSAQSKKHDDKTTKEAKGKSPVESSTGYRNLSAEFEDLSDNSVNEVNAAGTIVPTVGQLSTNNTNTFSVAGPSNAAVSPTQGKSSYVDSSQHPDDPNMPKLEDNTYSDDEYDVGAEADFNHLETSITEESIDYEEVFAPVARIEAIWLFLAYASFMGFMVYQMDVKSAFLYETIKEEVYVCQHLGFEDPDHPDKVYKVVKALYGLHQAPRAWYETLANYLLENGFQRGKIDQTLFIKRKKGDILLVQIYVDDIIFDGKSASTPIDTEKPLLKDPEGEDVDVHTYRSMIGSLMYLTSSRPDIMFAVCACAHFQVTPKASHLHTIKRIFRYLKGKPRLGLWYSKDSPFNLVAYSDSDYAGASLDRKSTTGGVNSLDAD